MQFRQLGNTEQKVSVICLGTMTWGEQNDECSAHEQLDYAIDKGVNFIDTAEMYPVPPRSETQGLTEEYIGNWLTSRPQSIRQQVVLASKVAGPGMLTYLRDGPQLNEKQITQALDDSLKRLKTDYIDLYQVHWPARKTNFFGELGYTYCDEPAIPIEETLDILDKFVRSGKIRYIGISNETAWGTMEWLRLAERKKQAPIVSIQNPYSLLNRVFEIGGAEIAHREQVGLLAYSPLGFGVLSGKYLGGNAPPTARLSLFDYFTRYTTDIGVRATECYVNIARQAGLDPAQMALAYVNTRQFVTSNIIGATTLEQLETNIASADIILPASVLEEIEKVHNSIPNPCP